MASAPRTERSICHARDRSDRWPEGQPCLAKEDADMTDNAQRSRQSGPVPRRLAIGDLLLAEAIHGDECLYPEHAFALPHFTLLLKGSFEEVVSGRGSRHMRPLDAAFSPPSFAHRDRVGRGGARLFTLWLQPSAADEFLVSADFW